MRWSLAIACLFAACPAFADEPKPELELRLERLEAENLRLQAEQVLLRQQVNGLTSLAATEEREPLVGFGLRGFF